MQGQVVEAAGAGQAHIVVSGVVYISQIILVAVAVAVLGYLDKDVVALQQLCLLVPVNRPPEVMAAVAAQMVQTQQQQQAAMAVIMAAGAGAL